MVPFDSSAARIPLPGHTMALAILFNSAFWADVKEEHIVVVVEGSGRYRERNKGTDGTTAGIPGEGLNNMYRAEKKKGKKNWNKEEHFDKCFFFSNLYPSLAGLRPLVRIWVADLNFRKSMRQGRIELALEIFIPIPNPTF